MAKTMQFAKTLSRRTLSVVLACAVFAVMLLTVLAGAVLFSGAGNPSALEALNHEVPVQSINMMPTVPGATKYINENNVSTNATSRTTFAKHNNYDFGNYLTVEEQSDESIKMTVKQGIPKYADNDTTYAWTYTQVNQMINL
ncbi:MAG: hypothetical protein IJC52_03325, partial [Clostridia bacterium]|nr:hypothetical protein [Clostridia bacterium]